MTKKILTSIFLFFLAKMALAYNLLQPLPGVGKTVNTFPEYIAGIIPFILGLAAVLAVVEIVIGGIEYAVTEAIDAKADAKDRITQAILGLILALASWLILNTINPRLVNLELNISPLNSPTSAVNLECNQACKVGEEICDLSTGTCKKLGDTIQPPSAKIEGVCLSSASIVLNAGDTCDIADCSSRGGSCIKAIEIPPILTAPIEKKAIVVPGNFPPDKEQILQAVVNSVYDRLPDGYRSLQKPTLILNTQNINDIREEGGEPQNEIEAFSGRSFSGAGSLLIQTNIVNGDQIDASNFSSLGGSRFEGTLVHELAHALATEEFGTVSGNADWMDLHILSVNENRGFALPEAKSDDGTKPYAAVNFAEDLAMTAEAYFFTNGQYKTGDKRSDEILAQKFAWLEKNGFVKKMR